MRTLEKLRAMPKGGLIVIVLTALNLGVAIYTALLARKIDDYSAGSYHESETEIGLREVKAQLEDMARTLETLESRSAPAPSYLRPGADAFSRPLKPR